MPNTFVVSEVNSLTVSKRRFDAVFQRNIVVRKHLFHQILMPENQKHYIHLYLISFK